MWVCQTLSSHTTDSQAHPLQLLWLQHCLSPESLLLCLTLPPALLAMAAMEAAAQNFEEKKQVEQDQDDDDEVDESEGEAQSALEGNVGAK